LSEADIADTEQVFAAIRLANPGGLGASERHDVSEPARAALGEVMAEAAGRDRIARQYATGFADLFEVAAPALAQARDRLRDEGAAVTELFLYLLARFPDSHLQRKHGAQAAARVSKLAAHALADWRAEPPDIRGERLRRLDADLKRNGFNPGTTADLTVATLFMDRLLTAADQPAGSTHRQNLRYLRLTLCGAPLISTLTI
jgi:triphosphoribosyl-dephospho-CoA synthase